MSSVKLSNEDLAKLEEVQAQVLASAAEDFEQWKRLYDDYQKLKSCLESLPTKMTHETMVPVGSVALLPVSLIHTNEILVLLGDNWFTQCSSVQALSILQRRLQFVEENMMAHSKASQRDADKLSLIQKIQSEQAEPETFEIQEPIEDESEYETPGSRVAHTPRHGIAPRSLKELDRRKHSGQGNAAPQNATNESLWKRLDRLELEEEIDERKPIAISDNTNDLDSDDEEVIGNNDCGDGDPSELPQISTRDTSVHQNQNDTVVANNVIDDRKPATKPMSRFKASRQNR